MNYPDAITIPASNVSIPLHKMLIFLTTANIVFGAFSDFIITHIVLSACFFFIYIGIVTAFRIVVPKWFWVMAFIYLIWMFYGLLRNSTFHLDFKYQLIIGCTVLYFSTFLRYTPFSKIKEVLLLINLSVTLVYILLALHVIPISINPYEPEEAARGYGYRINGPDVFCLSLFPMLYLIDKKPADRLIWINFVFGCITLILNGSFQNLVIFGASYILLLITRKAFFTTISILFISTIVFYIAILPVLNQAYIDKLSYITHPWDFPTVKYRIVTVGLMILRTSNSIGEILFGSGFGVITSFFEINPDSPSLSRWRTFLEIDNGFFYVYHRGGLILLTIFFIFHFWMLSRLTSAKQRIVLIVTFLVANLLSIHYFTSASYTFIIVFLLQAKDAVKTKERALPAWPMKYKMNIKYKN